MNLLARIRTLARVGQLPERGLPEVAETVAIIMDGNGRWARRRGLPPVAGHYAGTRALRRTVEAAIDLGIRHMVVYAFSTENWSRPQEEVDALMELFGETIERELSILAEQGVRVRFIGWRDRAAGEPAQTDGGDGGPDGAEHAAWPLDRVRLRRTRRCRRVPARQDRRERGARLHARSTRTCSPPTSTRRSSPIRIC